MKNRFEHFLSWLYTRRLIGPRCKSEDYIEDCACCAAWKYHDELVEVIYS